MMDKSLKLGLPLLSLPMLIYPLFHFIYGPGVATFVPPWIPWYLSWTYFNGTSILAAGLAMVFKKHARLAAILLGAEILLFATLIHVRLLFHGVGDAGAQLSTNPRNLVVMA